MSSLPFVLESPGQFLPEADWVPDWVVYLHGFRSSPSSVKAQRVVRAFQEAGVLSRLWVPALPPSPIEAMQLIRTELQARMHRHPDLKVAFVGSSLGGFYATVLAEEVPSSRVVLINPAVTPHLDLEDQIGRQQVYFSDEEIEFVPAYLQALKDMQVDRLTGLNRYFLMAASDDEVLDFKQMTATYANAHQLRLMGSDHAMTEFEDFLPYLLLFLGVK